MSCVCVLSIFAVIFVIPFVDAWPYNRKPSLDNFRSVLGDSSLAAVYKNSLLTAVLTAALGTLIAYGAALITARSTVRQGIKNGIEAIALITNTIPGMVLGQMCIRDRAEGIKGEELNVIVGSLPFADDEKLKEPVKLMALKLLYEKYGITEKDFIRAEIEMVPAVKARDVGFDRSMVGAYGQDDRVCAYTALMAELEAENPE